MTCDEAGITPEIYSNLPIPCPPTVTPYAMSEGRDTARSRRTISSKQESWTKRLVVRTDSLLPNELRPFNKSPLTIHASVDEVRVVERQLSSTVDNIIRSFDTQHKGMILVADFVPPAAKAAAGVDVLLLELGQEFFQDAFTLQAGGRISMVEASVVGRNYLIVRPEHFGVEETLDGISEHVGLIDGFHA